ncbi:uncharacterized protein LOC116346169 [Contarinia nasturtii]|uniref:uncharacterized protein LOC116346169 n=1 Tax=Contarinia nasturtii TaxID=265458 RepID=UPI0012D3A680|nr:uncharacterized protein LOC116346169 [Contarinia nasturtii]
MRRIRRGTGGMTPRRLQPRAIMEVRDVAGINTSADKRLAPEKPVTQRKRRKLDNDGTIFKVVRNKRNHTASILKLNDHCFDQIFDWLSVKDLNSFSKTCTRLQQIGRQYFQRNYRDLIHFDRKTPCLNNVKYIDSFAGFYQNIVIAKGDEYKVYEYINSHRNQSIKRIKFTNYTLTTHKINNIRHILDGVEVLQLYRCTIADELYECILGHCVNLKNLSIDNGAFELFPENDKWLQKKYPTLEHFELIELTHIESQWEPKMDQMLKFLELNPNIRSLSVTSRNLMKFVDLVKETNIRLDELTVTLSSQSGQYRIIPYVKQTDLISLVNGLYELGFYKRLNLLNVPRLDKEIVAVNGFKSVYPRILDNNVNLDNVKELWLKCYFMNEINKTLDLVAAKLVNLERVWLSRLLTAADEIAIFVKYAPKLKEIYVDKIYGKKLDLTTLNKEREKLRGARKVTIYVDEKTFLETKWNNKSIDLSLVTLKRKESYQFKYLYPFDNV